MDGFSRRVEDDEMERVSKISRIEKKTVTILDERFEFVLHYTRVIFAYIILKRVSNFVFAPAANCICN